jgi:prevent-host-death family protein
MVRIGSYEAKTRLAELLKRVEAGERITITRHGRDIAILGPAPGSPERTRDEALEAIRRFREGRRLGSNISVHDLIEEGRRR